MKNPSLTLARDKANIEYISGAQPSPYELAFGVKLDSNPHSKSFYFLCLTCLNTVLCCAVDDPTLV